MRSKIFGLTVLLLGILLVSAVPVFAQSGPKTPYMQIHIYLHPDPENMDLEAGVLDINDWPLSKEWVDKWALMPDEIALRDYVEMGMMEIDMNNQQWPTGCPDHKFFDPTCEWCQKALAFRKAVAYLTDRDRIIAEILKGYGYRLDLPLPPFQSAYMDMPRYRTMGLIYDYNKTKAIELLDNAGFVDTDGDGIRNDPRKIAEGGDPSSPATNLDPLIFYIRMDDPNRMSAGLMLAAELESIGVPVDEKVIERTVCYKNVMVLYNYHLYTGGWSLGTVPDQYHDLYSSFTYYGPDIGWSLNYPGFCNHEFDEWALKVKYPSTIEEAQEAAKKCGELFLTYCPIVPLWSSAAVKAYRVGWEGVVNEAGYGIDNGYTFLNMYNPADNTIDWGFKSDIEQLNMISSEWLWDHNVLGLIYESLLGTNPFNLAPTEYFLAESYTVEPWEHWYEGELINGTKITYVIRSDVAWHDGSPLTVEDVKFSFDFNYACGAGVSWNYPLISDMNQTVIVNSTAIEIYYNHFSAWAVQWSGGLPIVKKAIWELIEDDEGRHWTDPGFDFTVVRAYDPVTDDVNGNGVCDLTEDGTGPWIFDEYSKGNWVKLHANSDYYLTQDYIENRLAEMFHFGAGDVDSNGIVSTMDALLMARALGTDSSYPHGTGWNEYNPDCDLNGDGVIDALDLAAVLPNYGKTMG